MKLPEWLSVWTGAAVLTVLLTWPVVARIGSIGRFDNGDARFSIWNVAWVAHALTTAPSRLYDANIFSPARGTLAYSEPNLLAGIIAAPAWWVTKNPHVASNWVILWSFVLAAVTMYVLVRRLSASPFGAAFAAVSSPDRPTCSSTTCRAGWRTTPKSASTTRVRPAGAWLASKAPTRPGCRSPSPTIPANCPGRLTRSSVGSSPG